MKNLDRKDAAQKEKDAYRLLSIFALQGLTEFKEFVAERKGVIADLGRSIVCSLFVSHMHSTVIPSWSAHSAGNALVILQLGMHGLQETQRWP